MSSELETGKPSPIVRARSNARWQEPLPIKRLARGAVTRCAVIITRLASYSLAAVRRDRLGVVVSAAAIEAVYLRRARVTWHGRVEIARPHDITDSLRCLLAAVPQSRRPTRVVVAFGPPWAQVRRLPGPSDASPRGAAQTVREHATTFFHHRAPILIAPVHRACDGSLWSCAFDRAAIEAVVAVLRERGLPLHKACPAVAVAGYDDSARARVVALETSRVPLAWRPTHRLDGARSRLRTAVIGAALGAASALLAALTAQSVRDRSHIALRARCTETTAGLAGPTPDLSADTLDSSEVTAGALAVTSLALASTSGAVAVTSVARDVTAPQLDATPASPHVRADFRGVTPDFSETTLDLAAPTPLFGDVTPRC